MYPGFPVPNVEPLAIWDTSEPVDDDMMVDENSHEDDFDEPLDEEKEDGEKDAFDNWGIDGEDEDPDIEEEFDDWGNEDENEQEDDY
jgi:hypothetical protein